MSKAKHRFYRKILDIKTEQFTQGAVSIQLKFVTWCAVESLTSRTVRTKHIGFSCYIGNEHSGIEGVHPSKSVSINLKNPMQSKFFKDLGDRRMHLDRNRAFNQAYRSYIAKTVQGYTAKVSWFDKGRGEGSIHCEALDTSFPIYACGLPGKKTWYAETACMYLERGDKVQFDLSGNSHQLFVVNVVGPVKFDAEKWNGLDQDRLAFKCDDDGKAINGLFA